MTEKITPFEPGQCGTCHWWHAIAETLNKQGTCIGRPPTPIAVASGNTSGFVSVFPVTDARQGCGGWCIQAADRLQADPPPTP